MRSELVEAISLIRKGDAASLEKALQMLQRTLFSFGLKLCGQRQDAEDTAQEVLVKALPHLAKLDEPAALSTWLYKAAKNRCWEGRRKVSYRKEVPLEDLMPGDAELAALLAASQDENPETSVLTNEDHERLRQAVLQLPPQYRIVLVLHDMEELDTELVARILNIQSGTVRVNLHRARLMLRRAMVRLRALPPQTPPVEKPRHRREQCGQIFANLSDYLDGELEPENCDKMRRHIEACPTCLVFIKDLKMAIDQCRTLELGSLDDPSPALRRLLTEEYLRLKKKSSQPL